MCFVCPKLRRRRHYGDSRRPCTRESSSTASRTEKKDFMRQGRGFSYESQPESRQGQATEDLDYSARVTMV